MCKTLTYSNHRSNQSLVDHLLVSENNKSLNQVNIINVFLNLSDHKLLQIEIEMRLCDDNLNYNFQKTS